MILLFLDVEIVGICFLVFVLRKHTHTVTRQGMLMRGQLQKGKKDVNLNIQENRSW